MEVAYEPQHRSTMIFNTTSGVLEDPDGKERNAWEGFTAGIQPQANTRSS